MEASSSLGRPLSDAVPSRQRSRLTNNSTLALGTDGRTATARRFRDLITNLISEHGGEAALSTVQLGAIRQAAAINLHLERLQAAIVRGEVVDADALIRLSSESRRILGSLRKHASPTAAPSLAEHLASRAAERRASGRTSA
jgi:hypothetical protein